MPPNTPKTSKTDKVQKPQKKKGKVVRNIALEKELVRLGVPETEVYEMSRWEQSVRYEDLLQKEIADADAEEGKESGDTEHTEEIDDAGETKE